MSRSAHRTTDAPVAPLDPSIVAELDQLDAALRGEPITDETLATLVRDVQAQAPVFDATRRAELTDRVDHGFSRRRRPTATPARPTRRGRVLGAGAAALVVGAFAFVILGTSAVLKSGDDQVETSAAVAPAETPVPIDQLSNTFESTSGAPADSVESQSGTGRASSKADSDRLSKLKPAVKDLSASGGALASTPSSSSPLTSDQKALADQSLQQFSSSSSSARRVERAVDMAVRVRSGKLDEAAARVGEITRAAGGFVATSSVNTGTRGRGIGSFALTVPSSRLDATVGKLADLGTVTRQEQQSTDITGTFDATQARLADAKAERRALLRSLAKATTSGEIASLRSRIADNRSRIATLDAQVGRLRQRSDRTTITLTVNAPAGDAQAATDDDGTWSLGDAAHDAGRLLGTVTGVLLVGAGALLPLALLGGLAFAGHRLRRRRAREAALGD